MYRAPTGDHLANAEGPLFVGEEGGEEFDGVDEEVEAGAHEVGLVVDEVGKDLGAILGGIVLRPSG